MSSSFLPPSRRQQQDRNGDDDRRPHLLVVVDEQDIMDRGENEPLGSSRRRTSGGGSDGESEPLGSRPRPDFFTTDSCDPFCPSWRSLFFFALLLFVLSFLVSSRFSCRDGAGDHSSSTTSTVGASEERGTIWKGLRFGSVERLVHEDPGVVVQRHSVELGAASIRSPSRETWMPSGPSTWWNSVFQITRWTVMGRHTPPDIFHEVRGGVCLGRGVAGAAGAPDDSGVGAAGVADEDHHVGGTITLDVAGTTSASGHLRGDQRFFSAGVWDGVVGRFPLRIRGFTTATMKAPKAGKRRVPGSSPFSKIPVVTVRGGGDHSEPRMELVGRSAVCCNKVKRLSW